MERVKLENLGNHKFLVYTLAPEEILDPVILGMMENNAIQGLMPVNFLQKDEQQILKYDMGDAAVLAEFLKGGTDGLKLLLLLKSMADILIGAGEYMIEETFFLFGMHSVFVGEDGKGQLICLPVENRNGITFQQFCIELMKQPEASESLSRGVSTQVNTYLTGREFMLREFSQMLDKIELQSAISPSVPQQILEPVVFGKRERVKERVLPEPYEQPVVLSKRNSQDSMPQEREQQDKRHLTAGQDFGTPHGKRKIRGYLYRKASGEKIEVDREMFQMGKGRENIDYHISGNSFISRQHAKIIRQGNSFYIEDMHSLNHTYVSRTMLQDGQRTSLADGTEIRLANEEFIFLIEKEGSEKRIGTEKNKDKENKEGTEIL